MFGAADLRVRVATYTRYFSWWVYSSQGLLGCSPSDEKLWKGRAGRCVGRQRPVNTSHTFSRFTHTVLNFNFFLFSVRVSSTVRQILPVTFVNNFTSKIHSNSFKNLWMDRLLWDRNDLHSDRMDSEKLQLWINLTFNLIWNIDRVYIRTW